MSSIHQCDFCDRRIEPHRDPGDSVSLPSNAVQMRYFQREVSETVKPDALDIPDDGQDWIDLCGPCLGRLRRHIKAERTTRTEAVR